IKLAASQQGCPSSMLSLYQTDCAENLRALRSSTCQTPQLKLLERLGALTTTILRPSTIAQRLWDCSERSRPAHLRIFPKSRQRSDHKELATAWRFPLGGTMSDIGGKSEVSALRKFFAV